jgi:hypothetical protein
MRFPEDPDLVTGLWESFEDTLQLAKAIFIVESGKVSTNWASRSLSKFDAARCVERFRNADVKRLSANHGLAVPPYGAFSRGASGRVFLTELTVISSDREAIVDDIKSLAVAIFFGYPELVAVSIPQQIDFDGQSLISRISLDC